MKNEAKLARTPATTTSIARMPRFIAFASGESLWPKQTGHGSPTRSAISLAHAKFTDAGAVHLAKLTKLKGLELGTHNATPAALRNLTNLPLESIQLGEGFHSADAFTTVHAIPT